MMLDHKGLTGEAYFALLKLVHRAVNTITITFEFYMLFLAMAITLKAESAS